MIGLSRGYLWRWLLALVLGLAVTGLFGAGWQRLHLESDIMAALPQNDPVLADARYILAHHPIYDKVAIDVAFKTDRPEMLTAGADLVEARLRGSGLFREVGLQSMGRLFPALLGEITTRLPLLFSEADLRKSVAPLLKPGKIREIMQGHAASLQDLSGIGQTQFIASDPLALRNLVLARLSSLAPARGGRIENSRLISADGRHILVVAEPASSGMDTRYAAKIAAVMENIANELRVKYGAGSITITPVGAYRAALDNEISAKRNVHRALLFSTIAIAVLLIVAFPRPLIGLLALLPAFAGTMLAFFVYSLWHKSLSLMAMGFGGAIISFTVDYGLAYLLFLDRPEETRGLEASRELWSLGLLAMLTTAVSFAFLSFSGFPIMAEIGEFAALGVVFTYIFVHAVFPIVFPVMPAAKRPARLPMQRLVNVIASPDHPWKLYAAVGFGLVMLCFARPDFRIDLEAMNAMSTETRQADQLIRTVWGDVLSKAYLMVEGKDAQDFQQKSDRLATWLDRERAAGRVAQFFVASSVFPGQDLAGRQSADWRAFWTPERIATLRGHLTDAAKPLGFAPNAFDPFLATLTGAATQATTIPPELTPLLGIRTNSGWTQVVAITPGAAYHAEDFYRRATAAGLGRIFDPGLFSQRLGSHLQTTFLYMAVLVGLITLFVAFFYFLDWRLTLLGVAPTLFAVVCTLGTLNLLGQPLGIPVLIVSVVVIGMGTDYALYLIRAYQRYGDEPGPAHGLIRLSVFLSFGTTFLGFGVLALSDNPMLRSAGLGLACGIGYSFIGAVTIAPPVLKRIFRPVDTPPETGLVAGSKRHTRKTLARYRHVESYPRIFVRLKLRLDPMFPRLYGYVGNPRRIIDIGCGYAIPASWLLTLYPEARVHGIEPDPRRVRTASRAVGSRGTIIVGAAPDVPEVPEKADTALILDMLHFLTDEALGLTLKRLRERMTDDGRLVIRATLTLPGHVRTSRRRLLMRHWLEWIQTHIRKGACVYRTEAALRKILHDSGFEVATMDPSAPGHAEVWVVARPAGSAGS